MSGYGQKKLYGYVLMWYMPGLQLSSNEGFLLPAVLCNVSLSIIPQKKQCSVLILPPVAIPQAVFLEFNMSTLLLFNFNNK